MHQYNNIFFENEYTYLFLEHILYALQSPETVKLIEKELYDSKLLYTLIHDHKVLKRIPVNEEKCRIDTLVKHLENHEKKLFQNAPKLNIDIANDMPISLIMDVQKVDNILFHLLIDLYQFTDHTKSIDVKLSYKDKVFTIQMNSSIPQKNTLFDKMFKKMNKRGDNDRLGLQTAKKLAERLNGNIDIAYSDKDYTFTITLPSKIIKIG